MWSGGLFLVAGLLGVADSVPDVTVVAAVYRADQAFPQFLPLWSETWARLHAAGESLESLQQKAPLGGYIHIYLRNNTNRGLEVADVLLDDVSLSQAIASSEDEIGGHRPASLHFSTLSEAQRGQLIAAGEPVWWKADPHSVPAGGCGEIVIRLRRAPQTAHVSIAVVCDTGVTTARVDAPAAEPRIVSVACSQALDEVTLYVRDPRPEPTSPETCWIDGIARQSVVFPQAYRPTTADAPAPRGEKASPADSRPASGPGTEPVDRNQRCDTLPIVIRLDRPFSPGSFHMFEIGWSDGARARAALRVWSQEFVYGMWGYTNSGRTPEENARLCLTDLSEHHINVHMGMGGNWRPFIASDAGSEFLQTIGMRMMVKWIGDTRNPVYYFLMDEPDAQDYRRTNLPADRRLGCLAQPLVQHSRALRGRDPLTPQLLNVNNTYKPENWYTYGQLADVLATDPYYQEQLAVVYGARPGWLAQFVKPTCVYAATVVCAAAAQPKPVHVILNAVRHDHKDQPFRFATPAEKRIELYYALAGGAKGISYWWYTPYDEYYGVGGSDPHALALWKEIGLLGAEVRTAGPLIVRSCPATLPVQAPPRLWARTLLAGLDTLLLIVVNDNYAVDRHGTVVHPVQPAIVRITPPPWLHTRSVFEVAYTGTRPVSWSCRDGELLLDLGTVQLTRLLIISADENLQRTLDAQYRAQFAAKVARLLDQNTVPNDPR